MEKNKPVFSVNYFTGSLEDSSENKIPYIKVGKPRFVRDKLLNQKKVLSLPHGSAIGYLLNNEFYDCLSEEMTLEVFFCLKRNQKGSVNVIIGNHSKSGGFSIYESFYMKSFGGMFFSVNAGFDDVTAKVLNNKKYSLRGRWHHAVGVFKQGIVYFFHNGSFVASSIGNGDVIGEIMHTSSPDQILFVGGNVSDGKLDLNTDSNVRVGFVNIFDSAFDENSVKQRYEKVKKCIGGIKGEIKKF